MTKDELIESIKHLPGDAPMMVCSGQDSRDNYCFVPVETVEVDPLENVDYLDDDPAQLYGVIYLADV